MAEEAVLLREEKKRRMMAWKAPWNEPSGLIAAVVSGKPLAAASSLCTLVPSATGPTPAIDTDDALRLDGDGGDMDDRSSGALPIRSKRNRPRPSRKLKPSESDSIRRSRMLGAFVTIVLLAGGSGASLFADQICSADGAERLELMGLALEGKRTATLACRLTSITSYLSSSCRSVWPPTADSTYSFFRSCATAHHAASRAARFLEALRFLKVLGFNLDSITESPILTGYSLRQSRRLGLRKQATALEPAMVAKLEEVVAIGALDPTCLIVAGGFLLALLLRARFSDLGSWTGGVSRNRCSVSVEVVTTKTSGSITDRLGLYLVGPTALLTKWDWIGSWLGARASLGLTDHDPVFPAGDDDGHWTEEPARLQDVNRTLKQIFTLLNFDLIGVSTHAAKATLLHWAALYGLSLECRERLGYHASKSGGSVRAYSRDHLAKPVEELTQMLEAMRAANWSPDAGWHQHGFQWGDDLAETISPTAPFVSDPSIIEEASSSTPPCAQADPPCDSIAVDNPDEWTAEELSTGAPLDEIDLSGSSSCDSTDSDASNAESDEEAERLIISTAEAALGTDRSIDIRRYMNVQVARSTIHAGRPGVVSRTRCGIDVESLQLLASGNSELVDLEDESKMCKKCFRN